MGTFVVSNSDRHPTELAKLAGARLVVAQETQEGRRWDETKIKAITGGDPLTARFMRQDFFDIEPTFKLFLAGNNKPRLTNVDEAMRRRLLLVPFTVQIPPAERNPNLAEKLKAEWPAILRWCIDGCLEWQRIGLTPPAIAREATENYLADEDMLPHGLTSARTTAAHLHLPVPNYYLPHGKAGAKTATRSPVPQPRSRWHLEKKATKSSSEMARAAS
jgi:putative DNA primase/helicase